MEGYLNFQINCIKANTPRHDSLDYCNKISKSILLISFFNICVHQTMICKILIWWLIVVNDRHKNTTMTWQQTKVTTYLLRFIRLFFQKFLFIINIVLVKSDVTMRWHNKCQLLTKGIF